MAVFEYQNKVIFDMTVFDGGPSLSYWRFAFGTQEKTSFLEFQKQVIFIQHEAF
jgi:hypothetical protein